LDDLGARTPLDLLRLQAGAVEELRRRGIVRTGNNPVGDYAEHLCARAFGWTLATNSTAGLDAVSATGRRFQIKARRLTGRSGDRELGSLEAIDGTAFDDLVVVLFAADFTVARAALLTSEEIARVATPKRGRWLIRAEDRLFDQPGVVDLTERLRAAQAGL